MNMPTPPFGKEEEKRMRELGPMADQVLAGETPVVEKKTDEGDGGEAGGEPDVKTIMSALKVSEDSAKMILEAARKNPDLSGMEVNELVKYLKKNPTMLMRLMQAGSSMEPEEEEMTTMSYGPEA